MNIFRAKNNRQAKNLTHFKPKQQEYTLEIDPNAPIIVSQDLFGLMIEIERVLKAHGISSATFISDVMSAKTKSDEVKVMQEALETLESKLLGDKEHFRQQGGSGP